MFRSVASVLSLMALASSVAPDRASADTPRLPLVATLMPLEVEGPFGLSCRLKLVPEWPNWQGQFTCGANVSGSFSPSETPEHSIEFTQQIETLTTKATRTCRGKMLPAEEGYDGYDLELRCTLRGESRFCSSAGFGSIVPCTPWRTIFTDPASVAGSISPLPG